MKSSLIFWKDKGEVGLLYNYSFWAYDEYYIGRDCEWCTYAVYIEARKKDDKRY